VINFIRNVSARPSSAICFATAGDSARDAKDWIAAVDHYEAYLTDSPSDAGIWVQLGNCAKEAGDYEKSMDAYRSALSIKPEDADIYLQLGHLHKLIGSSHEAVVYYREALVRDPSLSDARHEITRLEQVTASLVFLLPTTFLDLAKASTIEALMQKASQAQPRDDPFQKYLEIIIK
jgi:tetratricopeptide (TPR) repeat protein